MRIVKQALQCALLVGWLVGCSDHPDQSDSSSNKPLKASINAVSAKDLKLHGLMLAVFAKQFRPGTYDALAELPDPENRQHMSTYVVTALTSSALPNGDTVLVANAALADEKGNAEITHAAGGLLCIYFLRSVDGTWQVQRKAENVTTLGSYGAIGSVKWTSLGVNRPGMVILNNGSGQGVSVTFMSIFDLTASDIHDLAADSIKLQFSNEAGCAPERDVCWNISGAWDFETGDDPSAYADLVIHFTGKKTTIVDPSQALADKSPAAVTTEIDQTARYVFDGRIYRLAIGSNPIPEI